MARNSGTPRRGGMIRNIVHLGLGQVATTILTIVLNATLARSLGAADFGLLYLLTSIASFAYVVVDWGHAPLIIRETARDRLQSGLLMGSAMALRSATALVACVVVFGITWLLGYDLKTRVLAVVLILGLLPQYLGLSLGWVFRGIERMERDAQINVLYKLVALVLSLVSLKLGGHVAGLILAWTVAGALTLVCGVAMYRSMHLPKLAVSAKAARGLLRDGVSMFAMTAAVSIEPLVNANILYKTASSAVVGWYGANWAIVGTLLAPATVLGAAMFPRLSAVADNDAEFRRAFDVSFRPIALVAILGAVGTYLFADVPIEIIYTLERFGPAADNLRACALVMLLMYVDIYLANVVVAARRASRLAIAKIAAVVVSTALVFVLVPICQERFGNGGLGAIYAMAFGELLMFVASYLLIKDVVDGRTFINLLRSLLAGAATILIFRWLPPFTPFLGIPACVVIFAGIAMLVGAFKWSDVEPLLSAFRKQAPAPATAE